MACANSRKGKTLQEKTQGLYQWGTWDTKVFTQCGAKITQAYDPLLTQCGGFTVSMEDYASEVQLINLSPTRRRQTEQKVATHEQSLFRALAGQMNWLAQQCCPTLVAPLFLIMGETNCATVDTQ